MIVYLMGGLGNQMFQYAFAKALEQRLCKVTGGGAVKEMDMHNAQPCSNAAQQPFVVIDASHYLSEKNTHITQPHRISATASQPTIRNLELSHFTLSLPLNLHFDSKAFFKTHDKLMPLYRILKNLIPKKYKRPRYKYFCDETPHLLTQLQSPQNLSPHTYFYGYFHNLAYFEYIFPTLRADFTLRTPLTATNLALKERILSTPHATFVHIRRGDYLASAQDGVVRLDKSYYERAFALLKEKVPDAHLYIFSNDIPWCKEHFCTTQPIFETSPLSSSQTKQDEIISTLGLPFSFIEGNDEGAAAQELELMRSCKHGIIANSTFSWWAAYLMDNPHKVIISPKEFLHNPQTIHQTALITPKEWLTIPTS